jgi:hypothetical protein
MSGQATWLSLSFFVFVAIFTGTLTVVSWLHDRKANKPGRH